MLDLPQLEVDLKSIIGNMEVAAGILPQIFPQIAVSAGFVADMDKIHLFCFKVLRDLNTVINGNMARTLADLAQR